MLKCDKIKRRGRPPCAITLLAVMLLFLTTGCGAEKEVAYTKTDFYFDTVVTLTVYEKPSAKKKAEELLSGAMEECRRYDVLFDPRNEESDLYKINNSGGEEVLVSDETATLLYAALKFCDSTRGKIDISNDRLFVHFEHLL